MPQLESIIQEYAARLEREYPDLTPEEVLDGRHVTVTDIRTKTGTRALYRTAIAAAVALVVGLLPLLLRGSSEKASDAFQSLRGRIVYVDHGQLIGVDPSMPESTMTVPFPDPTEWLSMRWEPYPGSQAAQRLAVAGWSSDGLVLALESEYFGEKYLMDADGSVARIPTENVPGLQTGCCGFVTSNWLSPDGSTAALASQTQVALLDVATGEVTTTIEVGRNDGITSPSWSPDGSAIAFVVHRAAGEIARPSVHIGDVARGTSRELTGTFRFGYIRQVSWSPDGLHLLIVGSDTYISSEATPFSNPLAGPIPANLYAVDIGWTNRALLSRGHYVSAAWSPDGTRIAAIDFSPSGRTLVLMNADGKESRPVADFPDLYGSTPPNDVRWYPG